MTLHRFLPPYVLCKRCKVWLEKHPWVGYYVAVIVSLDFLLHIIESKSLF